MLTPDEVCPICKSSQLVAITTDTGHNRVCRECDFKWTKGGRRMRSTSAYPRNKYKEHHDH